MSTTRLPIVLLVAGVVALAGCGDDDDGGDSAGAEQSTAADTSAQSSPASGA